MKMLTVSLLVCALMALAATQDDVVEPSQAPEATEVPAGTGEPTGTAEPDNSTEAPALEELKWFEFQGRNYTFVATPLTWATAEKRCLTLGANLASVHNQAEHQFLLPMADQDAWLGGSDCQEDYQRLWSDGRAFTHNEICNGTDSRHFIGMNCLQMNHENHCWEDIECSQTRPFFCVKPRHCPVEVPSDQ